MSRLQKMIFIVPLAILGMVIFVAVGGKIVMDLWNWLLPTLFGWRQSPSGKLWGFWCYAACCSADTDGAAMGAPASAAACKSASAT